MNELVIVFIAALLGSYHCIGMCSTIPITFMGDSGSMHHLTYNLGRLFAYGSMGFLAGAFGLNLPVALSDVRAVQMILSIIFGAFMIILGIEIMLRFRGGRMYLLGPVYDIILDSIKGLLRASSYRSALLIGFFNGFLPCPLVYAFLMKAVVTFDPLRGMVIMLTMGLGTIPAMFILCRFFMKKRMVWAKDGLTYVSGLLVAYLGIVSLLRGLLEP